MPLPLILIILAAVTTVAAVVVAIIYYDDIVAWFRARNELKSKDKDKIAVTIKTLIGNGEYKVVQGIFNTRSDELVDSRVMRSKALDERMDELHDDNELVIWE